MEVITGTCIKSGSDNVLNLDRDDSGGTRSHLFYIVLMVDLQPMFLGFLLNKQGNFQLERLTVFDGLNTS